MQATTDPKKIAMKETNHIEGSKGKINVSHPVSRLGFKIKRASLLGVTYNITYCYMRTKGGEIVSVSKMRTAERVSGGIILILAMFSSRLIALGNQNM